MKHKTLTALFLVLTSAALQGQQGLRGEYYNGSNFEQKVLTRTDPRIYFSWFNAAPAPGVHPNVFSVRWTGKIKAPETGKYLFRVLVDDGIRLRVGGQLVIDAWGLHDYEKINGAVWLEGGRLYDLQIEYFNAINEGEIQLFWQLPSQAPVFGGALGYNDKPVDSQYFFAPPDPPAQARPASPQRSQPPAAKPKPRPATPAPGTTSRPQTSGPRPAQPATPPKDTLEKYIPRNIHFEKSKSVMLPESYAELDRLGGFLTRNPAYRLTIEGHTDKIGDSAKNQELSEQRARAVASYLVKKGVAAARITAKGYGDSRPLIAGSNDVRNRRVEFRIERAED